MKLNKKLTLFSISLGLIPNISKADLYQCVACPAGTYGNGTSTSCTKCKAGTYAPAGSSSCTTCKAGSYSGAGAGSCTPCPTTIKRFAGCQGKTFMGSFTCRFKGEKDCNNDKNNCTARYNYEPAGYVSNSDRTACTMCSNGTGLSGTSCKTCSAGTYSKYGLCTQCSAGQIVNDTKTGCINISSLTLDNFTQLASGSAGSESCPTGTLQPGWYLVRLRGGSAGNSYVSGGSGGTLQYIFYLTSISSYQLCAGGNGTNATNSKGVSGASGGGGGSWLKLNWTGKDYYFVAGGGGGANGSENAFGGGGGGGIGSGGAAIYAPGGRSGPYAGAASLHGGNGLNNGNKPENIFSGGAGGGGGGKGFINATCAPITINIITGYKTTGTKTGNFGGNGGNPPTAGTSSHSSNASNISSCGSSCAILYKLNI